MNNKNEFDAFDESYFVVTPSEPLGQKLEDKISRSGVVALQVIMGGALAYLFLGASQEFSMVVMVLAMTAIGVTHKEISGIFKAAGRSIAEGAIALQDHRIGMAMMTGAIICKATSRLSNKNKGE